MRTFTLVWFGQLLSTIGSYMSEFALVLWAWQLTNSATALALVVFFSGLPQIPISLFSGLLVDRFNRKRLMILGDAIAALATLCIGALYLTDSLQVWHIYLAAAINGGFGQIQRLAYQASVSLLVSSRQYIRANSMNSIVHYGAEIVAPAFAGYLYPHIQLSGILWIDLATFGIAITTLLCIHLPQSESTEATEEEGHIFYQLTFGLRYVWTRRSLRKLIIIVALFSFAHDLSEAIYDPMILARTNGNAQILASTAVVAGIGGVTGAVVLSAWGGPKHRIQGIFSGFIGVGLSKLVFGLGQSTRIWLPAQLCSSLSFPLLESSETAIWMESTEPELQGRVFAANELVMQLVSTLAALLAGPLADNLLEPMMASPVMLAHPLGYIFGTGAGAGSAVLYVLCAIAMLLIGIVARALMPKK
ncbi:MAG: MFS transporter [Cyanobacteria bacterium P01_A01_bin.116]